MQKVKEFCAQHQSLILVIVAVILTVGAYWMGRQHQSKAEIEQKPQIMQQTDTESVSALKNALDVSQKNAESLFKKIQEIQAGRQPPAATYYISAPDTQTAAKSVEQQIASDDPGIPAAARKKTDRTVVTPITQDSSGNALPADQQKVDVYKINLRKDHRIKVGASMIDGSAYESVGYEQGRVEVMTHFKGTQFKGATVTYNVAEW